MKELKKILVRGLVFIAVTALIYIGILYTLYKIELNHRPMVYRFCEGINLKGGNTYQKFQDFDPLKKYDILVIGSSHAYRGYDPRIFRKHGIDLFNLGTSAQTMVNSYYIAKNYITHNTCKLVILDAFDGALMAEPTESSADLIQNISSDKAALELALNLREPRAINMFLVRQFNKSHSPYYVDSSYAGNGFTQNFSTVNKILDYNYYQDKKINPVQLKYMVYLIKYLKVQDVPFIVVNHPLPRTWNQMGHTSYAKAIDSIAVKEGGSYLDYGRSMPLDEKKYFYDAHHINQNGVEIYNDKLINDLDTLFNRLNLKD